MKMIILAAGQGTRLRPLTDHKPKCMVEINGKSIVDRQVEVMKNCGIEEKEITILCGYRNDVLKEHFKNTEINFVLNAEFETTNMVYSLMCAKENMQDELIVSYGDIVYSEEVLQKVLKSKEDISVVVDDGWHAYWSERCENPLDDAETLKFSEEGFIIEIGQKPKSIEEIQSQYIGLMKFSGEGLKSLIDLCDEAKETSEKGLPLSMTERNYNKMYMTDMLQGLIQKGKNLSPLHIHRGWFEVDNPDDLKVAEKYLD